MTDSRQLPGRIEGKFTRYSERFRSDVVSPIVRKIVAGECISLIGVGTVGKTQLINHFSNTPVFNHNMQTLQSAEISPEDILYIKIDPNALIGTRMTDGVSASIGAWPGYELIASRLMTTVVDLGLNMLGISDLYGNMIAHHPVDQALAFRHLEEAFARIFQYSESNASPRFKRVILIFDEFEHLYRTMPANFFINLRALRDEFRYKLLYLTISRSELYSLPTSSGSADHDSATVKTTEPFIELFKHPVYITPPENTNDRWELLMYLNTRLRDGAPMSDFYTYSILELTGGHGGLLRTAIQLLDGYDNEVKIQDYNQFYGAFATRLLSDATIQNECDILLNSFTPQEQNVLVQISQHGYQNLDAQFMNQHRMEIMTLHHKSMLTTNKQRQTFITSPLLEHYIKHHQHYRAMQTGYSEPANKRSSPPPTLPEIDTPPFQKS